MNFDQYLLHDYKSWKLFLHENQCYLGRVYILAKRKELIDLLDTTEAEGKELYNIAKTVKNILNRLFSPDLMNYASLGNRFKHLHVHIIPRYKDKRIFHNQVFNDERWGNNFSPYNTDFQILPSCLEKIKTTLRNEIRC